MPSGRRIFAIIVLLAAVAINGCSAQPESAVPQRDPQARQDAAPAGGPFTHVVQSDTEYYTSGPQQGRPPDGTFKAGVKVRVIEEAGSYSRVESADGVQAYVAGGDLAPLAGGAKAEGPKQD